MVRRAMILFGAALAGMLLVGPAMAKPVEISGLVKAAEPLGKASLKVLVFHAYDAELWTDAKPFSYDAPFALMLTYRMDFSTDDLVERSIQEMEGIYGAYDDVAKSKLTAELTKAFPNVTDGDRITAYFVPAKGVTIYYNGVRRSAISTTFAKPFMDIWMSEKTSEPGLRKRLLGKNND